MKRWILSVVLVMALAMPQSAFAWSNGDNYGAGFGTHDWVLYEAYQMAGSNGYGWLDINTAMTASDDPDMVLRDTYHHVYDIWGDTYGDAPTHVQNVFADAMAARDAGNYQLASQLVGRMSHYFSDICNPLHTDQSTAEESVHGNYEEHVDTQTDSQNENDGWITSDGLSIVDGPGAVSQKTVAAATASHADYATLVTAYAAGNGAVYEPITQRSLNRAVNGLADLIETLESGSALSSFEGFDRIAGATRFDTAAAIAKEGFPAWSGVQHVVVASGDDKAMADPLAAASLCWAYDAPLLLTSATSTPSALKTALAQIASANPGVKVHVIGGSLAVPGARLSELGAIVGAGNVERISGANRFATAVEIARAAKLAAAGRGKTVPDFALVANGYESSRFFDALALSTISASTGAPILLCSPDADGSSAYNLYLKTTRAYLLENEPSEVFVAGGTAAVSDVIASQLGAYGNGNRLAGQNRYGTAVAVAERAIARRWLSAGKIGVASKMADALAGGATMGHLGGVLLLNAPDKLSSETGTFMRSKKGACTRVMVFGGLSCISAGTFNSLRACIDPDYVEPQVLTTVQVQVSDPTPKQYSNVTVRVTALDQNGAPISGANANSTWRFKTVTRYVSDVTGGDGVAPLTYYISGAAVGYRVYVDVSVSHGGKTLSKQTSFVPE